MKNQLLILTFLVVISTCAFAYSSDFEYAKCLAQNNSIGYCDVMIENSIAAQGIRSSFIDGEKIALSDVKQSYAQLEVVQNDGSTIIDSIIDFFKGFFGGP